MVAPNTLLVLGAGSSLGFGLPLGTGLRETIADDLNIMFDDWGRGLESGSHHIVEAVRTLVRSDDGRNGDINPHRQAAVQIAGSMRLSSSIDEYIERHKDDALKVQCAKLAIAKAILEAERGSTMYADPRGRQDPFENSSDSWLAFLLRDLTRGVTKGGLEEAVASISIINFNYDRCVEHFAYHWFQRVYDLSEAEAADVCRNFKIYHPYGSLGPLPYQDGQQGTPFGGEIRAARLIAIADRIKTYSEAVDEVSEPSFVKSSLSEARRMIFLGFGFHRPNVRILGASGGKRTTLRCYASTAGIPEPRLEIIKSQIASSMHVEAPNGLFFEHVRGTCEEFWNEYGDVVLE
jgi:hypothetical protein